jgi:hypothetical protein
MFDAFSVCLTNITSVTLFNIGIQSPFNQLSKTDKDTPMDLEVLLKSIGLITGTLDGHGKNIVYC